MAQVQELAPGHPGVLNAAGMRELIRGEPAAARPLLEKAVAADSGSATLWLNLALANRDLRDDAGEAAALERALVADPRFYPALLQKARLFERQGKTKQAAFLYQAFLFCLPPGDGHPPALQAAVAHARQAVEGHLKATEAFLEGRLKEAKARHPGERMERVEACYETLMGRRGLYMPAPTFMQFPRLPAIEFPDCAEYPWLDAFEAATPEIRAEAQAAFSQASQDFQPYISKPVGAPLDQWGELNDSRRWSSYFLLKNGKPVDEHLARCPRTAALLKVAPLCDVPMHAPTAFFSVLAPKTRIPPHTGVTNTRFIVHLPLVVPAGCGFRVGAEKREWREGKAWVFDDTFEHEAWNDSDVPRIILIFDVWNSFLTAAERDLVSVITHGVQEFGEGASPFAQGG
ncbi:hypothetical protein DSM104440_01279 [Usitatibacter palustris]|uniref:Aspartyl/asparaginy/proline hydroxylase domain-containing protein n=2 Tax=Usitatibacter palustris TaxID=2732487 RepID=A0A6M4H4E0_9PROT|nr:hypothetical protein DSM104440_01279 [Usitatibacter palustris]